MKSAVRPGAGGGCGMKCRKPFSPNTKNTRPRTMRATEVDFEVRGFMMFVPALEYRSLLRRHQWRASGQFVIPSGTMDLNRVSVFVAVVDAESFTGAAARLG